MGNRVSHCFVPDNDNRNVFSFEPPPPLDEGLGHSFYYAPPPYPIPGHTLSTVSTSNPADISGAGAGGAFKSISGASVSANTSTPRTIVLGHERFQTFANVPDDCHAAFESTPSFASLPLQPVPRGGGVSISGPITGGASSTHLCGSDDYHQRAFMSGPLLPGHLERGFLSGPLERASLSGPIDNQTTASTTSTAHFSAPLADHYHHLQRHSRGRRAISHLLDSVRKPIRGSLTRTISSTLARTRRSLVAPVRHFVGPCRHNGTKEESTTIYETPYELRSACSDNADPLEFHNIQWAQGKAGEDRAHVVVSEDHRWLFVGIYDGFNGPDAPDFLMRNLYSTVYKELQGILWDSSRKGSDKIDPQDESKERKFSENREANVNTNNSECDDVHPEIHPLGEINNVVLTRNRTLRELLADANVEAIVKPSGASIKRESKESNIPNVSIQNSEAGLMRTGMRQKETPTSCDNAGVKTINNSDNVWNDSRQERVSTTGSGKSCSIPKFMNRKSQNQEPHKKFRLNRGESLVEGKEVTKDTDHDSVLRALARALELTEEAYLAMTDHALEENPELALMGSCILVALMKDKDVYVLNVGDSRAIVAQERNEHPLLSSIYGDTNKRCCGRDDNNRQDLERISEESPVPSGFVTTFGPSLFNSSLDAVQLSIDHSTSIEEEVCRIKAEHPDDDTCILNDRVKGTLKVTRAFGAGFLKKPRWNSAILEMFQIAYVGSSPYVNCTPALHHHRLGPKDRFLILSSDGLYQYFSNQEVVSYVEWFMDRFPEGDPAQYLIEELLFRAAKKAGMDFHELLDIPQGDRRKYHDDVSLMVIAIDGRIWRSSG